MAVNISHPYGRNDAALFAWDSTAKFQDWPILRGELDDVPIMFPSLPSEPVIKRPVSSEKRLISSTRSGLVREASIPVDQLLNEALWPEERSSGSVALRTKVPVCQTVPL